MILTEEEAKGKRCQESFSACREVSDRGHIYASVSTGGAFASYTAPAMCIGSACMAWRWKRGSVFHPAPPDPDNPGVAHFIEIENRGDYSKTHGFCGKAGRP